ncbi:MAG: thiamine-phosphate kinase [Aquificaceae bacterium]|nr:thiamine-phosphate kinase [Aquificaceae bacterium]
MKISEIGEDGLINRIVNILKTSYIGDDTAHVSIDGLNLSLTCDILIENRHFLRSYPPSFIGWKAISVNVSDIVASGARPLWALVSIALPNIEVSYIEALYEGIKSACEFYGLEVVGGNLSSSELISIDVFMVGKTKRALRRFGASPGEGVFVSGTLGDSKAGLEILLSNKKDLTDFENYLVERHLRPTARIDMLEHIVKNASACMDISDGLLRDLDRLAKRSKVGIELYPESIPLSKELKTYARLNSKDALELAMIGGEDYQLLWTQSESSVNVFLDMHQIGRVIEGEGIYIKGSGPIEIKGFDHFAP